MTKFVIHAFYSVRETYIIDAETQSEAEDMILTNEVEPVESDTSDYTLDVEDL